MYKVLVFAGTSDGRQLAERLVQQRIDVTVSVATEYGRLVLPEQLPYAVHIGRMTTDEMAAFLKNSAFSAVVDATHPYAVKVSKNITAACEACGVKKLRLLRRESFREDGEVWVDSLEDAVDYLTNHCGNALLATGSKELEVFTHVPDYQERFTARVLPSPAVVEKCCQLGFTGKHLICMQGPFSSELNTAMLRQLNARYFVTKDSGDAGGFPEKRQAAKGAGAILLVIARPQEETGHSIEEVVRLLAERSSL